MRIGLALSVCSIGASVAAAPPVLTSLDVAVGTSAGGTAVTLTGTGFATGDTVTFGGASATSVVIVSATSITCVTPAGTLGAADVVVTDLAAHTSTLAGGFVYFQDPTLLTLTGLWRGSFAGTPWTGVASAGSSSGKNLPVLGGSQVPGIGTAINGFAPATFNGTNQALANTADTTTAFITTTAYFFSFLIKPVTAVADTTVYDNPGLVTEAGGNWGIVFSSAGVRVYHSSATKNTLALATGSYAQVDITFTGGVLKMRKNGGAWTTVSSVAATGGITASAFRVGINYGGAAKFTGDMMEILCGTTIPSDAQLDGIYAYRKARYPAMSLP